MALEDVPPVIDLLEEEEEEWPDAGAQNLEEAQQYVDRINNIFDHLSELIHEDKKDALGTTIRNFKKWIVKQWVMMGDADINIVLHTIRDPATVYLQQHLTRGGVDVFDPPEDIPSGSEFIRQLPEREHDEQKKRPSSHPSLTMHLKLTNTCHRSAPTSVHWPKITDRAMLHTVINGAV